MITYSLITSAAQHLKNVVNGRLTDDDKKRRSRFLINNSVVSSFIGPQSFDPFKILFSNS